MSKELVKLRDILKLLTLSIKCFDIDVNNKVCFLILGIEIKSQVVSRIYATVTRKAKHVIIPLNNVICTNNM